MVCMRVRVVVHLIMVLRVRMVMLVMVLVRMSVTMLVLVEVRCAVQVFARSLGPLVPLSLARDYIHLGRRNSAAYDFARLQASAYVQRRRCFRQHR